MAGALTFLLIGCLLQGTLCEKFMVDIPQTVEAMKGSCVTIPCSFDINTAFNSYLNMGCEALWIDDSSSTSENPEVTTSKEVTGDLTKKDCTTTFKNVHRHNNKRYFFRLNCEIPLRWNFVQKSVNISVQDGPPSPTLTPPTVNVKEGESVRLTCSAPAPCLPHPPTLTWSPSLGNSQETLQDQPDRTKVKTSVVTFTASHLHHGQKILCTAVYKKQDGSTDVSVAKGLTAAVSYAPKGTTVLVRPSGPVPENSNLTLTCSSNANPAVSTYTWYRVDGDQETVIGTGPNLNIEASKVRRPFFCKTGNDHGAECSNNRQIDVHFPPHILSSSGCTKTASQITCSCETVGNPSPTLHWYLDGVPVNQSAKFTISNEPQNGTGLRSSITVNQPQERDLSTLRCHGFNSLGSVSHQFCVKSQDRVLLLVFITTVVTLLVLVCVLLVVIRAQKNHHNPTRTVPTSHLVTGEGNEVPTTIEGNIYVSSDELGQGDVAHPATISEPNSANLPSSESSHARGAGDSSEKNEQGSDVIYSSVNWTSKRKNKKGEDSVDMNASVL